jgi:hypothetical protein
MLSGILVYKPNFKVQNIVAFRPIARQQATMKQPLIINDSANKHILRQRENILYNVSGYSITSDTNCTLLGVYLISSEPQLYAFRH